MEETESDSSGLNRWEKIDSEVCRVLLEVREVEPKKFMVDHVSFPQGGLPSLEAGLRPLAICFPSTL